MEILYLENVDPGKETLTLKTTKKTSQMIHFESLRHGLTQCCTVLMSSDYETEAPDNLLSV